MEQEIVKLLNVLRLTARAARYAEWTRSVTDASQFCIMQYNRILARLGELEPAVKPLFPPLQETASSEVLRMAVRELIAYFEVDEPRVSSVPVIPPVPWVCGPRRRRVRWMPMAMKCD
ncbi:MAG TPA: hypothetical protein VM941_08315 [Pyrinomonadaceae bacterium]|jgi:hypothetical protein|nr:hypothetical protein [Pyrinomonadaceae bacterium]